MYNTLTMSNKLEILKKRIIYRASYRGTKEMDILLTNFVNKYINILDEKSLLELDIFLNIDDETILDFYQSNKIVKNIKDNTISNLFKDFKI
jgi:antitoxin CptB